MAGIKSGEVISIDDFIQLWNGLEHYGVKTDLNGLIDFSLTGRFAFPAREDLTKGTVCSIKGAETVEQSHVVGDDSGSLVQENYTSATVMYLQSFTVDSTRGDVKKILFDVGSVSASGSTFTGQFDWRVYEMSGDGEKGTLVGSGTNISTNNVPSDINANGADISGLTMPDGDYVIEVGVLISVNGNPRRPIFQYYTGSVISDAPSTTLKKSTDSGSSYSSVGANSHLDTFEVIYDVDLPTGIQKGFSESTYRSDVLGIVIDDYDQGETAIIQHFGVISGLSGLTVGSFYYSADTVNGTLTTTTSGVYKNYFAISETELLIIDNGYRA